MTGTRRRRFTILAAGALAAGVAAPTGLYAALPAAASSAAGSARPVINCASNFMLCTEVADSESVFGKDVYVGHDEPSINFYSNRPGSGNSARFQLVLPREPAPTNVPGMRSYSFELHPTFWFGMALCATQSYPELVKTCLPDTNLNIVDPKKSPYHPGTAFMELQFYPPGSFSHAFLGEEGSCSATQWCVAMAIDSLAQNPVNGKVLNNSCTAKIGGSIEYANYALLTHNGRPTGPPNPLQINQRSFSQDPKRDLLMNQGDRLTVTLHDTASGLETQVKDLSNGQSGLMVASAANGFGQIKFAPAPSTACTLLPYSFHPMYSTSTPQTRVTWAAHTYNVGFSDEVGHWDFCSNPQNNPTAGFPCKGTEGAGANREPTDGDDFFCFPGQIALLIKVSGCIFSNVPGFDGSSYLKDWPNGQSDRPTTELIGAPKTGPGYTANYTSMAFETNLPRVEEGIHGCDPFTATGCTHLPFTDDGTQAPFYPFFFTTHVNGCMWGEGQDVPGLTVNDYGRQTQYGSYDTGVYYTGPNGVPFPKADDFRHILPTNPCTTRS